jgi:hypothetical protein
MSELTPCNFCSLRGYRERARRTGREVVVRAAAEGRGRWPKGMDVFMVKPGEAPGKGDRIAWFMELTDKCAC